MYIPFSYWDPKTVIIGTQRWSAVNLNVDTYRDGTPIPEVTDNTAWSNLTTGAWCYYNNDPANGDIYGRLYNWYAVSNTINGGLAPVGQHIPTDAEFTTLTTFLGGDDVAGGKIKSTGTTYWVSPNTGATNESGLTVLGAGQRIPTNGLFSDINYYGFLWSSTENFAIYGGICVVQFFSDNTSREYGSKKSGFSVRCIID